MMRRLCSLLWLPFFATLISCGGGGGDDSSTVTFAGPVRGSDAFLFVLRDGDTVNAYVCDGHDSSVTIANWFKGITPESSDSLTISTDSGSQLSVAFTNDAATGQLSLADGTVLPFSVAMVDGEFGLYRGTALVNEEPVEGGWILLPDGSQRGAMVKQRRPTTLPAPKPTATPTPAPQGDSATKVETAGFPLIVAPLITPSTKSVAVTSEIRMSISQQTSSFL